MLGRDNSSHDHPMGPLVWTHPMNILPMWASHMKYFQQSMTQENFKMILFSAVHLFDIQNF